ncbi:MAG: winged helix-turn-helix transcriptional regulator [Thaumarchaeota archaeon]|nr:MAG: winged helix-turn-helix transcriptional regulator [Nitrososphaerota archaeon]
MMSENIDKDSDLSVKAEEYIEVISTEDERIKIIGEELANDTGRAIFGKISQGIASTNDLAKALNISLPLVNWHINRLLSVGLIKVEKVEMSSKNKQMKYYGPVKTALVIVPAENATESNVSKSKKETVLLQLRHYLAGIAAFIVGSSTVYVAEKSQIPNEPVTVPQMAAKNLPQATESLREAAPTGGSMTTVPSSPSEPSIFAAEPTMILLALLGGAVAFCVVFFVLRYIKRRKQRLQTVKN